MDNPDQKSMTTQKTSLHLSLQQDAVGLQAVGDHFVTTVTLLELDHLCKKIQPA